MPQRFLRPGITTSDAWNAVSFPAQSLYVRLLTLVDDFGRADARVPVLHGQCFALRPDVKQEDTASYREELHNAGLIQIYQHDGKDFLQMTKWKERARTDTSKFPAPPQDSAGFRSGPQDSAGNGSIPQAKDASLAIASIPSPSPASERTHADAEQPTEKDVVDFGRGALIPDGYCREYHAKRSENHEWFKHGRLIDWRSQMRRYWHKDMRTWREPEPSLPRQHAAFAEPDAEPEPQITDEERLRRNLERLRRGSEEDAA